MNIQHLSTSTPASEISSADFARNDGQGSSEADVPSMADILRNSPAAALLGMPVESQTEDTEDALTQDDESEGTDPASEEESENKTESEESSEEDAGEDDEQSTQESGDLPEEDDIDWEYKIPMKIDGELKYVTLEEARKGYATSQHLSNEGRKLGELKKEIEKEKAEVLSELVNIGTVLHNELSAVETSLQNEYAQLTADIDKAREGGDTYTARELKDKREVVQEKYWAARNKREEQIKGVSEQLIIQQNEAKKVMLAEFNKTIPTVIPDFNDKVAKSIREFALKEGIPDSLLSIVYDANVIKFINDYRKLKTASEKGASKRREIPTAKSVPTKKGTPQRQKEQAAVNNNRQKVLSGNGDSRDQMDFLKRISKVSQKL